MGDDGCSASELRRRYHMGGDLKDDSLTAPQLRARYGIKKNTAEFSTKTGGARSGDMTSSVWPLAAVLALVLVAILFAVRTGGSK
ncbi:unnamed protein product [Ectocarpus sp. CCAP 1310/34]|nr:unnamed protein product [Ectocarpus sp. CCAP 1310/34]